MSAGNVSRDFSQGYVIPVIVGLRWARLAACMRKIHAVTQPAVMIAPIKVATRGSLRGRDSDPGECQHRSSTYYQAYVLLQNLLLMSAWNVRSVESNRQNSSAI